MRIEPEKFAKTLKELREKSGISVRDLAEEIVGARNPRAWSAYEDTKPGRDRDPTLLQAKKLLKALGYTMTITIAKDSN